MFHIWPWAVGLPVLCVLATAYGAGVYAGKVVDRRLADAVAAADRDDPHWRLNDLMEHREAVPDEENSAMVLAKALELLPRSYPESTPPKPGTPNPTPNEFMQAYDGLKMLADNVRIDDETAAVLRDELTKRSEAVRIARTLADYRRGRHEIRIGPSVLDTPLAETQATRNAARLMVLDATMRAQDGDIDGGLDSCRAAFGVGRSIGDEPFMISYLVRIAIGGVALQSTRRVLAQGEPSDAALARLQALLLDELSLPVFLTCLKGERASTIEMLRRVAAGEISLSSLSGDLDADLSKLDPDSLRKNTGPVVGLWYDQQIAVSLEWLNDAVAIGSLPAAERPARWKAWDDRIVAVKESRFGMYTSTLPLILMPALNAGSAADLRYQATLGATAILLAAERHRLKTGAWPESIAAIDPQILANPPLDPFSGKPYLLDRRDGQWIVHSIGPNGRDDHGDYEVKRWTKGGPDDVGACAWDVALRRQTFSP